MLFGIVSNEHVRAVFGMCGRGIARAMCTKVPLALSRVLLCLQALLKRVILCLGA